MDIWKRGCHHVRVVSRQDLLGLHMQMVHQERSFRRSVLDRHSECMDRKIGEMRLDLLSLLRTSQILHYAIVP